MKNLSRDYLTNLLELNNCKKIKYGYYLVGLYGDITVYDTHWRTGAAHKTKTTGKVLIIRPKDIYFQWKQVYKNTKGYYINLYQENIYLPPDDKR